MKSAPNQNDVRRKLTQLALVVSMIMASCTSAVAPNSNATPKPTEKIVSTLTADSESVQSVSVGTEIPDVQLTSQVTAIPPTKLSYSPIDAVGNVEGDPNKPFEFSINLDESIRKREEAPLRSVSLNQNYLRHDKFLREFGRPLEGNNNPADTFSTFLQKILWGKYRSESPNNKDMTFDEYLSDLASRKVSLMIAKEGSVNTPLQDLLDKKASIYKEIKVVPTKIDLVAVNTIYGAEDLRSSYIQGSAYTRGVHVEETDGKLTVYFIPCNAKDISDLYLMDKYLGLSEEESHDKVFMISIVNALWLAFGLATREDVAKTGYIDFYTSYTAFNSEGNKRQSWYNVAFEVDDFYFRQGYRWLVPTAMALKSGTDESDATSIFKINH